VGANKYPIFNRDSMVNQSAILDFNVTAYGHIEIDVNILANNAV
jgi:hypothetical protein